MKRYLNVPFDDNPEIKRLGGQWDQEVKRWWIPETRDTTNFAKWIGVSPKSAVRVFEEEKPLPPKDRNSPAYARFSEWWKWWNENLPESKFQDHLGSFTRIGAIVAKSHQDV